MPHGWQVIMTHPRHGRYHKEPNHYYGKMMPSAHASHGLIDADAKLAGCVDMVSQ